MQQRRRGRDRHLLAGGLQAASEASWTATATTSGTALAPLATIGLTLAQGGEVIASGTTTADADGFITFAFDVPADASNVQVTVQGANSGRVRVELPPRPSPSTSRPAPRPPHPPPTSTTAGCPAPAR